MFREELAEHAMADQAHDFLMASGKLQVLCYKAAIEAQFRTPALDGFQLLGLSDFPGQGSAIVGLLNPFWKEKAYVTKGEIRQFCNQTVPLAELPKFVYKNSETLTCATTVSHYGPKALEGVTPQFVISTEKGDTIKAGSLGTKTVPTGGLTALGNITCNLQTLTKATQCKLEIRVGAYKNSWDFWVFPAQLNPVADDKVYYTTTLNKAALKHLDGGGKVLLETAGAVENGKDVKANFTPVFWNTSWFKMRPPHTLGILVQEAHPVFADFPTSYHSNYQWWALVNRQQIMCIDSFPATFRPLVQPIDTWFLNRRLAQLFEARVGNGTLMVSSLNLNPDNGPASAQLRHSIVNYMNSSEFEPQNKLSAAVIQELFEQKKRAQVNLYTVSTPDELKPNNIKKTK